MKSKGQNTGPRRPKSATPPRTGEEAAAAVLAAGGRVPRKFAKARPAAAGPTREQAASLDKITPARRVAFEILSSLATGRGHSDDLLRADQVSELSEADRNLATALVMGVLRWQIALDSRIRTFLERPDQRLAEPVAIALRLGAFQLLHMDRIPAHAALSESVELCRAAGQPHATGMVNAILRKLAGAPVPGRKLYELPAALAERLGHPAWLVERWISFYGREHALAICLADQEEPAPHRLFTPDEALPAIDDGSRLVAELAAAALPDAARVWDCCAAPGGKTLVLAARLPQAELLATDISERRMKAMQGRFRRYPGAQGIRTAVTDATRLPASAGTFDLVLCDVPCSGTGTLGRNPEIRLRLTPEDLPRQAERQQALLAAALARVAPGGRLVYSTCSLEPEENERIVTAAASSWRRIDPTSLLPEITPGMVVEGALRTLPGVHPCDGFYAVILQQA